MALHTFLTLQMLAPAAEDEGCCQLTAAQVHDLIQLHSSFAGVPAALHSTLCAKLAPTAGPAVLDALESFHIVAGATRARVALPAGGNVWLAEHLAAFDSSEQLQAAAAAAGPKLRLREKVVGAGCAVPGAAAGSVSDLLQRHSRLLPEQGTATHATTHYVVDDWVDAMESYQGASDGDGPSCGQAVFYTPLHGGRYYTAIWTCRWQATAPPFADHRPPFTVCSDRTPPVWCSAERASAI